MKKQLVQICSEEPQLVHCACCDGESKMVKVFYKELVDGHLGLQSYLDCCKDKVGEVVDWYNWEDYYKVVGKFKFGGHCINKIKGYNQK